MESVEEEDEGVRGRKGVKNEKSVPGEERSFSLITGERRSGIKENQISASDGEKRIGHRVHASGVTTRCHGGGNVGSRGSTWKEDVRG